jgi:zinc/manganese transport system substrate-binding protein
MRLTILCFLALSLTALAQPVKVACTNADLYALAREIGGNLVDVSLLVPSAMNPHAMPLRPSMVQKIREARLLMTIGLDHEPWLFDALTSSGNGRVQQGGPGYIDASAGIERLQIPVGSVDRSRGDLHIFGNTHYWLHPKNVRAMAVHVTTALSNELPAKREEIRSRARAFLTDLDRRIAGWKTKLAPVRGAKVASYHLTWPYLEEFAGFQVVGTLEIRPGIEPSPAHLAKLRDTMRQSGAKWIVMEPWYNRGRAEGLAKDAGAKVLVIQPSTPEGKRFGEHFDTIVDQLARSVGSK